MVLFRLTGEAVKGFVAKPSDREAVVRGMAESVVVALPDSHTAAAVSMAATSSGAFSSFETHELIEASDLATIAERARGLTYQPPGG